MIIFITEAIVIILLIFFPYLFISVILIRARYVQVFPVKLLVIFIQRVAVIIIFIQRAFPQHIILAVRPPPVDIRKRRPFVRSHVGLITHHQIIILVGLVKHIVPLLIRRRRRIVRQFPQSGRPHMLLTRNIADIRQVDRILIFLCHKIIF